MQSDASLRAFVEAEKGRCAVELAALRVEHEHQAQVLAHQQQTIQRFEGMKKKSEKAGENR